MIRLGIIGKPLGQSKSKELMDNLFYYEGIDGRYTPIEIKQLNDKLIQKLKDEMDGWNVTHPLKEQILPYLDELTPEAQAIGAVNVVKQRHEKLIGTNTDWIGFTMTLLDLHQHIHEGDRALILGTGGAARAIAYALDQAHIPYLYVSRTKAGEQCLLYEDVTKDIIRSHKIIINATPLGMRGHLDSKPRIPYVWITREHVMIDCIYNPEVTPFLKKGLRKGATCQNGKKMLIEQARAAWKWWNT